MTEVIEDPDTQVEKTSDDWYQENNAKVLLAIVDILPHRSETESWTLKEAILNLDKDPATILPDIEPLPLGVNAVDPVLAAVLQQNATLSSQVERLLSHLEGNSEVPADVSPRPNDGFTDVVTPTPSDTL